MAQQGKSDTFAFATDRQIQPEQSATPASMRLGSPLGDHLMEVAVPGGMMVVGVVVATLTFRWE